MRSFRPPIPQLLLCSQSTATPTFRILPSLPLCSHPLSPQVHGDVFRPPAAASLLCTYAGTGIQLFGMTLVTMVFALLGFLSPANRGGLTTAMLMMFVFMGLFAGYFAARMYKSFRGEVRDGEGGEPWGDGGEG